MLKTWTLISIENELFFLGCMLINSIEMTNTKKVDEKKLFHNLLTSH